MKISKMVFRWDESEHKWQRIDREGVAVWDRNFEA